MPESMGLFREGGKRDEWITANTLWEPAATWGAGFGVSSGTRGSGVTRCEAAGSRAGLSPTAAETGRPGGGSSRQGFPREPWRVQGLAVSWGQWCFHTQGKDRSATSELQTWMWFVLVIYYTICIHAEARFQRKQSSSHKKLNLWLNFNIIFD